MLTKPALKIAHICKKGFRSVLLNDVHILRSVLGGRNNRRRRLTAEEQLIMDLFRGYDTDARAVINTNNTVKVEIEFVLLRIQKLDERSQVLMTTGLVIAVSCEMPISSHFFRARYNDFTTCLFTMLCDYLRA